MGAVFFALLVVGVALIVLSLTKIVTAGSAVICWVGGLIIMHLSMAAIAYVKLRRKRRDSEVIVRTVEDGTGTACFTSTLSWQNAHAGELVIYCSDGRFAQQHEEFVRQYLRSGAADRVVEPGGVAIYTSNESTSGPRRASRDRLARVVNNHGIRSIVCIAHHDCGYYHANYPDADAETIKAQQLVDLRSAADTFSEWFADVTVKLFYADVARSSIVFRSVE